MPQNTLIKGFLPAIISGIVLGYDCVLFFSSYSGLLWFSSFHKNQHSKFQFDPGIWSSRHVEMRVTNIKYLFYFYLSQRVQVCITWERPFTRSVHMVWNKLCRGASYTVVLSKQRKSGWTGTSSFVFLRNLRIIFSVLCECSQEGQSYFLGTAARSHHWAQLQILWFGVSCKKLG